MSGTQQQQLGLALALLALPGCSDTRGPLVQSPVPKAELRQDWTPLVVGVPKGWQWAELEILLDGEDVTDPLGVVRRRKGGKKKGHQYIQQLALDGLEPGPHELQVTIRRAWRFPTVLKRQFTWKPAAHKVELSLRDEDGQPVPGRIIVVAHDGPVRLADRSSWVFDSKHRDQELSSVFAPQGEASVRLPTGSYLFIATRGLRDHLATEQLKLRGDAEVELEITRAVPTPGLLAADLHVHTAASYDAYCPQRSRLAAIASSGLDLAVLADHDRITDPGPLGTDVLGAGPAPLLVPGAELDLRSDADTNWDLAHITALPLEPGNKLFSRYQKTPERAIKAWRRFQRNHPFPEVGEEIFLLLAHPRGIHFRPDELPRNRAWALFNNMGFDNSVAVGQGDNAWMVERAGDDGPAALDFDGLEVMNRASLSKYREVRADWFALLNQGYLLTGTGNSDSHALAVELVGMPRNLVAGALGPDGQVDLAAFVRALEEGRVTATTGPVLGLEAIARDAAGLEERAGPGGLLDVSQGTTQLAVHLQAAPWVPVHELRVVQDGQVVERVSLPGLASGEGPVLDLTFSFDLAVERDAWVLVEAGWPDSRDDIDVGGLYSVVAPEYVPLAFTNPVRLDVDGDGVWTPPGLR